MLISLQKLLPIGVLFALAACANTVSLEKGYEHGIYHITQFAIEPENDEISKDPEYIEAKKLLTEKLTESLDGYEEGPEIGMTITITSVSLEINTARALIVGDDYRIFSKVTLWNPKDLSKVGTVNIATSVGQAGGLIGLAVDASRNEAEYKNLVVDEFTNQLLQTIYKKENK